ncbi:RNA polymerase sigma factor [Nonomuraea guangzhouensis]|uniref:RNA polymerase sigma factor n=1 Tax=Nonomuraea guangzhouensis TaxID=1291555 RepID=A0ABW4GD85_9ACTN|nr:RNA polymerase sigma factor [Nonomuraea guangzhouensis]
MTDELLVVRCQLGERAAFTELVAAWHVPVWSYVRRMLDADRADDVTQEIWLAVIRGLPRLKDPGRFTPWLFTIARRAVTNRLREQYGEAETPAPQEPIAEDSITALVDHAELVAGLSGLPALEREILVLFYLEDLSLEDCADICAVPVGTVKSRLNRARRLLREHLIEKGFQR